MTSASFTNITTVIGDNAAVSSIGGLITQNSEGLLAYLNVNDTQQVVGTAFLPNNAAVAAVPWEVRYLKNRPQAFYQTIAAHLSASLDNFEDPDSAPVRRRAVATDLEVKDGITINTLLNGFDLDSYGQQRRRGTNGLDWDFGSQGLKPYLTASLVDGDKSDAIVGIYDETESFILPAAAEDSNQFESLNENLLDVLKLNTTNLGLGYITTLIDLHAPNLASNTVDDYILTMFLPTDTALDNKFGALAGDVVDFLVWNKFASQLILANHAVNASIGYWSENVVNDDVEIELPTFGGKTLKIPNTNTDPDDLKLGLDDDADVVTIDAGSEYKLDFYTKNAVVHTFGSGLLATGDDLQIVTDALGRGENITDTLDATTHATLIALFGLASEGVQQAINSAANITTLLAPTEDAFAKLAENQKAYLTDPVNQDQLDLVLRAHLLNKPFWIDVEADAGLEDYNGFDPECSGLVCSGSTLSDPAYAKYGVRYSVDTVIIPDGNTIPAAESSESDDSSDSSNSAASALSVAGVLTAGFAFALTLF